MIQRFIHYLFLRRHFWRHASFSEISELYASRMLRMLALNMSAAFMSIFLYQLGYSLEIIVLFWAGFYLFKSLASLPVTALAAYLGPKHGILVSNLLYIPAMVAFALVPYYGLPLLIIVALFQGVSSSLYAICYEVDFSKVKNADHVGKEIAYMNIIEKVTTALSPLVGGFIAFIFGPQTVIIIAALLFAVAALPLLLSPEPLPRRQKLQFKGFQWRPVRHNMLAHGAYGFDIFASGNAWSLFVAISILGISATNEVYAGIGILLSVVLFAALAASYVYGKLIDSKKGKELLQYGAIANAVVHLFRPFITTPIGAAGVNISNEASKGYLMAYTKGLFDAADVSGQRVLYLGVMDMIATFGAAVGAALLAGLAWYFGDIEGLRYFFLLTAGAVLLILTVRFPLYRK